MPFLAPCGPSHQNPLPKPPSPSPLIYNGVVPAAADQRIVAGPAVEHIVPITGVERIVAVTAEDGIVPRRSLNEIVPRRAVDQAALQGEQVRHEELTAVGKREGLDDQRAIDAVRVEVLQRDGVTAPAHLDGEGVLFRVLGQREIAEAYAGAKGQGIAFTGKRRIKDDILPIAQVEIVRVIAGPAGQHIMASIAL